MELQHTFVVPADVDTAWRTLLDVRGVAPCFPGAKLLEVDGDDFTGQVTVKVGPMSLQYTGKGRFEERDEANHRAVISAQGSDKRGNGTAGAHVVARLTPEGLGSTRVTVDTQLTITGKPAQLGRGAIQAVGGKIVDQFAARLATQLQGADPVVAAPAAEPEAERAAVAAAVPRQAAAPATPTLLGGGDEEALDLNRILLGSVGRRWLLPVAGVVAVAVVVWVAVRH